MLITIVWMLLGGYFIFLGFEIVFLKKTKRISSLETHLYKNKNAFALRLGLIEFVFGILILGASIYALINHNNALFTYQIKDTTNSIGYNLIPLALGFLTIIAIWINQKVSEVKPNKTNKEKKDNTEE